MSIVSQVFRRTLFPAIMLSLGVSVASAQSRDERVAFAPGTSGATISGAIRGYETVDYLLGAGTGQVMTVNFAPSNPSAYFNVLAPGADTAIFNGSIDGNNFEAALPAAGDYVVQVYLMRNAARRDETAGYTLTARALG